jgi:hypothetical protein
MRGMGFRSRGDRPPTVDKVEGVNLARALHWEGTLYAVLASMNPF